MGILPMLAHGRDARATRRIRGMGILPMMAHGRDARATFARATFVRATVDDRAHQPDVVREGAQDRIGGEAETVDADPLQPADPDGHLGEAVRVGVDLDAVELPRADTGQVGVQAVCAGEDDGGFEFEVFQSQKGDVEEVAGAAGGVENLHFAQPYQELVQDAVGFDPRLFKGGGTQWFAIRCGADNVRGMGILPMMDHGRDARGTRSIRGMGILPMLNHGRDARATRGICGMGILPMLNHGRDARATFARATLLSGSQQAFDGRLDLFPVAPQRRHDHGVHNPFDVLASGEMRAELRTLGRVEAALEEGAEDGGIDGAPVERRDGGKPFDVVGGEAGDGVVVEEAAVEVADGLETEIAAGGHRLEERGQASAEPRGVCAGLLQHPGKDHVGQECRVFGEEAKNDAVQEVGDGAGVEAAFAHGGGNLADSGGGFLGDGDAGAAGDESLGIVKDGPHDFDVAGLGEGFERDFVDVGYGAGEVGAHHDAIQIAQDEQGRILQRIAVAQELVKGGVEILVLALVFPASRRSRASRHRRSRRPRRAWRHPSRSRMTRRWDRRLRAWDGQRHGRGRENALARRSVPLAPPCATWQ